MAFEQVVEIKEVEAKAQDIRRKAAEEAKKLLEDARQEVVTVTNNAEAEAGKLYKEKLAKAESEANIIYDSIILNAEKDCELIVARAEKNKKNAVSIIRERIVG